MPKPRAARSKLGGALVAWYRTARRDLPWRRTRDPYAIWLSEVMLQQTQVATVIPYWERFLQRFPSVGALAAAELAEVLAHWSGLGYYARARALHRAAQVIAQRHGGELPSTAAELCELPGFGPYTSGAVASIAFGERVPAVDGNVVRVLARIFEVEGDPSGREVRARINGHATALLADADPSELNQALMELGATVCTPRNPRCAECPVASACGARRAGRVAQLPSPKRRPQKKLLRRTCAVVLRDRAVLLARRPERGLFGGLWELPGADGDRHALAALLGTDFALGESLGSVARTLTHRELRVQLVRARAPKRVDALAPYLELRWADERSARALGMSSAMSACLERVWISASPVRPCGSAP